MITLPFLIAAGVNPTAARRFAPVLSMDLPDYGIDRPLRIAGFIGQIMVESAGFNVLEENLYYSTPSRIAAVWPSRFRSPSEAAPFVRNPKALANRVYAGRLGNGPEASGDGWRFRGRGLKQLTGRANYRAAGVGTGEPWEEVPDRLLTPDGAVRSAAWFWERNGLSALADAERWDEITRRVNGPAMLQARERRRATTRALAAIGDGRAAA